MQRRKVVNPSVIVGHHHGKFPADGDVIRRRHRDAAPVRCSDHKRDERSLVKHFTDTLNHERETIADTFQSQAQRPREAGDRGGLSGNSPLVKSANHATMAAVQETAPTARRFRSFADAEAWEHEHYRSLTPQQRMRELFALIAAVAHDEAELDQRVPRVRRITEQE